MYVTLTVAPAMKKETYSYLIMDKISPGTFTNLFLITFIEFSKLLSTHGLNAKVRYVTHKAAH